ncbi:MAG: hypothetical protein RL064_502, partial [Bacteroidota bacterium]
IFVNSVVGIIFNTCERKDRIHTLKSIELFNKGLKKGLCRIR